MAEKDEDLMRGLDGVDAKDFNTHLREACQMDLNDLERTGCVSLGRDLKGNPVIVLITHLGLSKAEKPEVNFRKMLLLFIRKAADIVRNNYCVVYAHSGFDIMNQYPLIYKFYALLPRDYKKNLIKMHVIHPNVGIRMFFEFARVFLSKKFYNKLSLYDTILDFQREIPPTQLVLPPKFLRKEDEDREIKYCGHLAPLEDSFEPTVGASKLLDICATLLRDRQALQNRGIFRVAGDEGELNLIKVRLQYANRSVRKNPPPELQMNHSAQGGTTLKYAPTRYTNLSDDRIFMSENKMYLLVGDIDALSRKKASNSGEMLDSATTGKSATVGEKNNSTAEEDEENEYFRNSENLRGEHVAQLGAKAAGKNLGDGHITEGRSLGRHGSVTDAPTSSRSPGNGDTDLPPEVANSIVVVTNVNTVAQMFKMAISHLPEPLVPNSIYRELITLSRRYEPIGYSAEYETSVATQLAGMKFQNLSTLVYIVRFLREVATESASNSMDTSNLAIIFAPTVFRPDMVDPMKAVMEMRLSKIIMGHLLDRRAILQQSMHIFTDKHSNGDSNNEESKNFQFIFENPIHLYDSEVLGGDLASKLNSEDVRGITDAFSPRLMNRIATMSSSSRGTRRGSDDEAKVDADAAVAAVDEESAASPSDPQSSIRKQDSDDDTATDIELDAQRKATFKDVDSDCDEDSTTEK